MLTFTWDDAHCNPCVYYFRPHTTHSRSEHAGEVVEHWRRVVETDHVRRQSPRAHLARYRCISWALSSFVHVFARWLCVCVSVWFVSVPAILKVAVDKAGDRDALRYETADGQWAAMSWRQYYDACHMAARAFIHLGLERHQSVNVIGFNSPQWFIADVGAILAGGVAAGIYTTNQSDACRYIVEHSEARVVVCEDETQLKKFVSIAPSLPLLKALVVYKGDVPAGLNAGGANAAAGIPVYSWADFLKLGEHTPPEAVDRAMALQQPGHTCTLIYTSGTTGNPKAVKMTHDNMTWTSKTVLEVIDASFGTVEEHLISYLPLSHVAAQMIDIIVPMVLTACRGGVTTVHFARPDALKGSLKDTLKAVRPTLFFGVPRVWEKFADAIKAQGAANTGLKKKISAWARGKVLEGKIVMFCTCAGVCVCLFVCSCGLLCLTFHSHRYPHVV